MWLYPLLTMGFFGLAFGAGLAYASKKFAVEIDPRVTAVLGALPGANCGGCGYPGCAGYAEAVVMGTAVPNLCNPGGSDSARKIGEALGITVETMERTVALIRCQGAATAVKEAVYAGVQTCALATLVGEGPLACKYACLMLGDCKDACQFNAITWEPGTIPVINETACTACRKCVAACPKGLINMRPAAKSVHVLCHSQDKGAVARKKCTMACIACTKCVNTCPEKAITMEGNLATINPQKCTLCGHCIEACPTKAIRNQHVSAQQSV